MDALSEAIIRLLKRQQQTDLRLAEIEKALGIARWRKSKRPSASRGLPLLSPRRKFLPSRLYYRRPFRHPSKLRRPLPPGRRRRNSRRRWA
jgi:hypothetical protein